MDVTEVLSRVGSPGRFAWIFLFIVYFNMFVVVFNDIFPGIYSATPAHHCRLPEGVSPNGSIPLVEGQYSKCEVYVNSSSGSGETTPCTNGWHFTLEDGEATVPTEWELVCDKKYLNSMSTSLYYTGIVVGSLVFGTLSDRVGRRPIFLLCLFSPLLFGSLIYFVKSFVVFVALRFIIGMLKQGLQINMFVLAMEQFVTSRQLGVVAALLETPWSVGGVIISFAAYGIKDWRRIQLLAVSPCVLAFSYFWIIPESLRWQISTRRYAAAGKTLEFLGKVNKVDLDERLNGDNTKQLLSECKDTKKDEEEVRYQLWDLFRYSKIRRWTLMLTCIWFINACSSYTITLGLHKMPGNRFVNLGISMAVEFPASLLVAVFSHRIKRRLVLSMSCIVTGVCCLATAFIPTTTSSGVDISWLVLLFINIARFFSAINWTVLNVMTCEMYPTVIRSIGYGVCVFAAKFGSILAPQLILLGDVTADWLPFLILGSSLVVAGFTCMLLPETRGTAMPDTIEEAEKRTTKMGICKSISKGKECDLNERYDKDENHLQATL